jgi:hypothetical protein
MTWLMVVLPCSNREWHQECQSQREGQKNQTKGELSQGKIILYIDNLQCTYVHVSLKSF